MTINPTWEVCSNAQWYSKFIKCFHPDIRAKSGPSYTISRLLNNNHSASPLQYQCQVWRKFSVGSINTCKISYQHVSKTLDSPKSIYITFNFEWNLICLLKSTLKVGDWLCPLFFHMAFLLTKKGTGGPKYHEFSYFIMSFFKNIWFVLHNY